MLLEWAWGYARGRNTYRLNDAVSSLSLGLLSQIGNVFMQALNLGIYTLVFTHVALWRNDAFWTAWYGWLLALVFYDFCYYWLHRMGHEVAVLWAAHVVHHQSQHYNLSTALRQTSSNALFGWIFYLPLALAGVPPLVFAVVALIDLLYQFWVHTEQVGKLGWFDRWFCSPSNHRAHHAINARYIDKNYGGILIVWDRLFGTFEPETEPCVYGTLTPLDSLDPLWANAEVYAKLLQDSWHTRHWRDKLARWFKPPGWRPADVAARFPSTPVPIEQVKLYDPPASRAAKALGTLQFLATLAFALVFLWQAHGMAFSQGLVWLFALGAALWSANALMQGRIAIWELIYIDAAALATACAALDASWFAAFFKPWPMLVAIAWVTYGTTQSARLLALALICSLAGDVFLIWPETDFIPGLVSFLLAHVAYLALFKRDAPWFASRKALGAVLALAAAMYAVLAFNGLPPELLIPVAVYVSVIALMVAQALGRAKALKTTGAWLTAVGAALFMVSDSLLAFNKFLMPLPLASLWVLGLYFAAQLLIVRGLISQPTTP
jgi:sterol desaturase/sphingolipid hydroxylase (fatty acid hydroxylase superfamily)/uncharacterized membrane protein YhhN